MDAAPAPRLPIYAVTVTTLPEGRLVYVSDAFCGQLGYAPAEVLGRTTEQIGLWADPADRARVIALLQERGVVDEFATRFRRRDGVAIPGLLTAYFIQIEGQQYTLG